MSDNEDTQSALTSNRNEITIEETSADNLHHYIHAATSDNTRKAYQTDIRHFIQSGGLLPANIEGLQQYLTRYATELNPRTLARRMTAIKQWHVSQGFPDPTSHALIRKVLTGIKNTHGKPKEKAPPVTLDALTIMVSHLKSSNRLIDWRNNALLQVGFFGAFRRSELVALTWEQIKFLPEGIEIIITRSKTDQAGEGQFCAIPIGNDNLCAVQALKDWQDRSRQKSGAVFCPLPSREGQTAIKDNQVNCILKSVANAAGLPNADAFSSHSLRRGFATEASKRGAPFGAIQRQGRWRHEGTVLGYIEEGKRFDSNAVDLMLNTSN